DGTWEIKPDGGMGTTFKVKAEGGRIFVLDGPAIKTGSVMIKGLSRLDGTRYAGTRLVGKGGGKGYYEAKTTLEVVSPNEMLEHIEKFEGDVLLNYNWRWTIVSLADDKAFAAAHGRAGRNVGNKLRSVELVSFSEDRLEASSQEQRVDPGAKTTVERSR